MARSLPVAALGLLLAAASASAIATVAIYANDMSTSGFRDQIVKIGKANCSTGGNAPAFRIKVGRQTNECAYRTPVVGRDLSLIVGGKLLNSTPGTIAPRTFIAVTLRNGGRGQYQLEVFPRKGSWKVIRDQPPNGHRTTLGFGKSSAISGLNRANKMRLDAINLGGNSCRIVAFVNGKRLLAATDTQAASLSGRLSGFSVGSLRTAKGAVASFDNVQVSVPNPFK